MHRSQIQESSCTQSAIVGGSGGTYFDELLDNCNAIVKRVKIRYGTSLEAIQMTYQLSTGREHVGQFYGGTGGTPLNFTLNVNVDRGERIVGVFGEYGQFINQLVFHTSMGGVFGLFGGSGCIEGNFHVDTCKVRGIFGRSGSKLDAIGFYCTEP